AAEGEEQPLRRERLEELDDLMEPEVRELPMEQEEREAEDQDREERREPPEPAEAHGAEPLLARASSSIRSIWICWISSRRRHWWWSRPSTLLDNMRISSSAFKLTW